MRLTVSSKANQRFIKDLSNRYGMTERECLNYLITNLRLGEFNAISNIPQTLPTYDDSLLEPQVYENVATEEFTTDPVIERLLAAGLDLDF